jgi:PilZ domain
MLSDRRKSQRRNISRHARVQAPGSLLSRDCLVTNISDGGVRLHVEGFEVPERFVLVMSESEGLPIPRDCQVVWRLGFEVGAEFLDGSNRPRKQGALQFAGGFGG